MKDRIWALVLVAGFGGVAGAGVNEWTVNSPAGADLRGIAYVDGNGTALAQSSRRIYRSTNHGETWTEVLATRYSYGLGLLAVNPANAAQALAVFDTVYRSTDGGQTWNVVPNAPARVPNSSELNALTWSRNGANVWLGSSTGTIYRSVDAGATWTVSMPSAGVLAPSIQQIQVDAVDPNRVYALSDLLLYETLNGGTTWTPRSNPYTYLATSPTEAGVLIAKSAITGETVRSDNYGVTLQPVTAPRSYKLLFAPGDSNRVYGFDYGPVHSSNNKGVDWDDRQPILERNIRNMAVSPTDPNRLLAATQAAIYSSSDGGASWHKRSAGMQELTVLDLASRFVAGGTGSVYAIGAGVERVHQRQANGEWVSIAANAIPLLGGYADATSFAAAPSDGTLYLGRYQAFLRSGNGGADWEHLSSFTVGGGPLVVDPVNPLVLYGSDGTFNVAKSVNGGASWTPFGDDLPTDVVDFAINDTNANRVYAVVSSLIEQSFSPLYVSENAGATWTATPWPYPIDFRGKVIAHEPGSQNTVYVGLRDGLYKTTNGGTDWTQLNPYPETLAPDEIHSIAIDPRATNVVYTTTFYAYPAMRSVDRGATWEPLIPTNSELELYIDELVIDPNDSHRLIGIGIYGGVYELTIAPDVRVSTTSAAQTAGTSGSTLLTVSNAGPYAASAVELRATLPAATGAYAVQASTGLTCAVTGTNLACDTPVLRANASLGVTVTFTPSGVAPWTATVDSYEPDNAATNNSLTVTVQAAPPPAPPAPPAGGGGGGGRLDYLLLLGFTLLLLARTPPLRRR